MATKKYNETSIEHYSGLDAIRKKPAMYLGNMNSDGLWTICREALDNGVDEYRAERNDEVGIYYDSDKTNPGVYVWDKGNGIPVGMTSVAEGNSTVKMSTLTLVLTKLHAGGKFNDKGYTNSGGTHGIGMKGVNAVSSVFEVYTFREKKLYTTAFSKGKETQEVTQIKSLASNPYEREIPDVVLKAMKDKIGTLVYIKPDKTMFEKGSKLDINYAKNWADLTSYLNPGLTIHVMSERAELTYYHDSLSEYLEKVYEDNKATSYHDIELSTTFDIEGRSSTLDIALGFTDSDATQLDFFTNGVKNPEGGKHYDAFWKAMKDVLSNYSLRNQSFTLNELREGVLGIVHLGLYQPQFASQTKEKLSDVRVYEPMYEFMCEVLTKHFNKNKAIAKEICQRASAISELKKKASATRQALLGIKKKAKTLTPTKLAGVVGRAKPEDIELIICEGDSAKGGLTLGRDKTTQMVLALKGKPLNAMKTDDAKVLASEEVANILSSIGYNPALKEPTSKLSCGKIILMSDADDDGFHINSLVISLLYKYLPDLFKKGMVYALDSANCKYYAMDTRDNYYFGSTVDDVKEKIIKAKAKLNGKVSYLKGWGELDPAGLRISALDKNTRSLIKLNPLTTKGYDNLVGLMGEDSTMRKELLGV